jgi:UDPglucose 6-dehydrogenase
MTRIGIVGSGVVGTATGKGFIAKGYDVTFTDINPTVIDGFRREGHRACRPDRLIRRDIDALFLTVPTPTIDGRIELKFLKSASTTVAAVLKEKNGYPLVVVRSTVLPGTTEDLVIPLLEKYSGKKAGKHFGVCMNPEYLREKNSLDDFLKPWAIVIGSFDSRSAEKLQEIYRPFNCSVSHLTLREAEIQKYIHNLFNAHKISFFNEMRAVSELIGVDADKVFNLVSKTAEASWNPEYGINDLGPYGGSCLPKDTVAFLSWAEKELKKTILSLKATIQVNENLKRNRILESPREGAVTIEAPAYLRHLFDDKINRKTPVDAEVSERELAG